MARLFGDEAQGRHAGLRVDLEQEQAVDAALVIPAEVGAARALTPQQAMRLEREPLAGVGDLVGDVGRADVFGQAISVFGVEIVPAGLGLQFGDAERAFPQHGGRQLAAADIGFGEQFVELGPRSRHVAADRIAVIAVIGDDRDADRRTFVDRLEDIGALQRIALVDVGGLDDPAARHGDAGGDEHLLGQHLVDRDDRGGEARMGIGDAHQVEHALHAAVLARRTVQRVEDEIGLRRGKARGDVAAHVDPRDAVAVRLERIGATVARQERYGAFGGPAAHEDRDVHQLLPRKEEVACAA